MGSCEQIPLFVNKEAVAEEPETASARGRGLVQLITDWANSGGERCVAGGLIGGRAERQATHAAGKESSEPENVAAEFLRHGVRAFPMASGSATKKVAGGARNGEVQKKGSPEKGQSRKRAVQKKGRLKSA